LEAEMNSLEFGIETATEVAEVAEVADETEEDWVWVEMDVDADADADVEVDADADAEIAAPESRLALAPADAVKSLAANAQESASNTKNTHVKILFIISTPINTSFLILTQVIYISSAFRPDECANPTRANILPVLHRSGHAKIRCDSCRWRTCRLVVRHAPFKKGRESVAY